MQHNKEKQYFEKLAKLILETFLPDEYHDLIVADKPDLQMGESRGIEVTRALFDGYGQASGIFGHIEMKTAEEVDPRHLRTLQRIGFEPLIVNGRFGGFAPNLGMWIDGHELRQAFEKKQAIRSHYQTFPVVDLFIFSPMSNWYERDIIATFMEWVSDNYPNSFSSVIVFENPIIYVYNLSTKAFRMIDVTGDDYRSCCDQALIMSEEGDTP